MDRFRFPPRRRHRDRSPNVVRPITAWLDNQSQEAWRRLRWRTRHRFEDLQAEALRRIQTRRQRPPADHPGLSGHDQFNDRQQQHVRLFSLNAAHGRRTSTHQALLHPDTARRNVVDIARVVNDVSADIVALQEADGPSAWSGNFDHVATLAEEAELRHHYRGNHNPFGSGRWNVASGTAVLSAWNMHDLVSHRFATNWRDTKGFVVGAVRIPHWGDREIDIVSVHLDFLRPKIRRQQILFMVNTLIHRGRPLVLLGDLNCCFQREPRSLSLFEDTLGLRPYDPESSVPTFPVHRPRRRLDWILISEDLEFTDYHTLRTPLSDHLGVVADLRLRSA